MSQSTSEMDRKLAALSNAVNSDRETLRRKLWKLLTMLNHGSQYVSRYGISVNVVNEMEKLLATTDDKTVSGILAVLRE